MTSYVVPATEEPTAWNKSAAVGAIAGGLVFPVVGHIAGAVIGGQMQKEKMQKELASGHVVEEPTALNKDAIIGGFIGSIAGGLLGAAVFFGAAAATGGVVPVVALLAATALSVGGTILGAMQGGKQGKEAMEQEYAAAQASGAPSIGLSITKAPAVEQHTTPHQEAAPSPSNTNELRTDHAARIRAEQTRAGLQQR